jgi:hypothetical protein
MTGPAKTDLSSREEAIVVTTFSAAHAAMPDTPLSELPEPIRRHFARNVRDGGDVPHAVVIEQRGQMWREPGGRPLQFRARQRICIPSVEFSWWARIPVAPLLSIAVHDGIAGGQGWMKARFGGFPFMRRQGAAITIGAGMRYLAELPWAPHAMAHNHQLRWRSLGPMSAEVMATLSRIPVAITLAVNDAGDIVTAHANSRPRDRDIARPWSGRFSDYATMDGLRIPMTAEVTWELPDGPFTYFRGTVTSLTVVPREQAAR